MPPSFDRSVFINCPFDEDFAPILQAIAFCVTELGFYPRLAPENADNAKSRLDRIAELIAGSRYAIHDLSRCKSSAINEYARMNMPFELGMDYGCKHFGGGRLAEKAILILEETRYDYQKGLSDISGWDICAHGGSHIEAVRHVLTWLRRQAGAQPAGATSILDRYADFYNWYEQRELARGASDEDIRAYPTIQMVDAMLEWVEADRPI